MMSAVHCVIIVVSIYTLRHLLDMQKSFVSLFIFFFFKSMQNYLETRSCNPGVSRAAVRDVNVFIVRAYGAISKHLHKNSANALQKLLVQTGFRKLILLSDLDSSAKTVGE